MIELVVIADDLTGALDTGAQFAKQGVATFVAGRAEPDFSAADPSCAVIAVNAESRHLPAREAAERVRRIVRDAMAHGARRFYKKTDSGLRGNVGAELAALIEAAGCCAEGGDVAHGASAVAVGGAAGDVSVAKGSGAAERGSAAEGRDAVAEGGVAEGVCAAVGTGSAAGGAIGAGGDFWAGAGRALPFVPAFPKNGRVTRGGVQYVDGAPLAESVFARDPFEPVRHSEVARIIREQADLPVISVPASKYRSGAQGTGAASARPAIHVYDAETDDDLRAICERLKHRGIPRLLAGCAGFAEFLPDLLCLPRSPALRASRLGCALLVCGSVSSVALGQLRAARAAGYEPHTLSPGLKLSPEGEGGPEAAAFARTVAASLCGRGRAALQAAAGSEDIEAAGARAAALGIAPEAARARIARNIGAMAWRVMGAARDCGRPVDTLIVFGGDTLSAVLRCAGHAEDAGHADYAGNAGHAGCSGLRPIAEILPGVAASRLVMPDGSLSELSLITKSGGFGGAVADIERALAAGRPPE
ncbi:MAG: four-carbon acid sugar kinase family protein [Clostridiales bacterium]|nr:four-carbon acid sugar kinase family protein [Clostridiales bacterium]